jgi:porin
MLAALLWMAGASTVYAQESANDSGGDMDSDSLAVTDTGMIGGGVGYARGEPSKPTPPYQATTAPSSQPALIAPGDWYGTWQAWKASLQKETGTSFDLFVNPNESAIVSGPGGPIRREVLWYNFHLEQQLWEGARLVTNTRGGEGKGLDRYINSDMNVFRNAGEADAVYISHFYLEQKLFNDHLTLSGGKMDLMDTFDTNEVASWNIIPYSLARNPSIPAPYHAIAGAARWDVTDWLYAQAGVADDGGIVTQTGVDTAFRRGEAYFSIYEIGIQPKLLGRPGTYRFIVWDDTATNADFVGGGSKHGDVGAALSFDQQITDHLGVYTRYGYSDPSVRQMNDFWSAGGTYTGLIPSRKNDILGLGVAQAILSDYYRRTNGFATTETQVDLYYTIYIEPWISVTPDMQVFVNPDGIGGQAATLIAGLNVEMRF